MSAFRRVSPHTANSISTVPVETTRKAKKKSSEKSLRIL